MIAQGMIGELQHEAQATRKMLEVTPIETKADYKPHEKSMPLAQLASHIVESLSWTKETLEQDEFVMDMATYKPYLATSTADLLATFDRNLATAIEALGKTDDATIMKNWAMKTPDGNVMLQMPKIAVMRGFVLNHIVHHRAQLGVYLRMLDVALPQVYGPTADNPQMGG